MPDPRAALEVAQVGAWSIDATAGKVWGDPIVARLLSLDDKTSPWTLVTFLGAIAPEHVADFQHKIAQSNAAFEVPFRTAISPQSWVQVRGAATALDPVILTGVMWDISAEKAHEHRLTLLASEMDHRVKNAFAVIRALITLAVRASPKNAEFGTSLKAQVAAMATAHTVSARISRDIMNSAAPVPLMDVLDVALAPWRETHDIQETVPADLLLAPQEVSPVSMLIYELSTNATKYGALGERGGKLSIMATCQDDGTRVLVWEEVCSAGPLAQTETLASDTGFGTVLVDHCAKTLGADVSRNITDVGLTLRLTLQPFVP